MTSRAGMSDAEYEALKARLDAAFKRWTFYLGLRWWNITTELVVDRSQFAENGDTAESTTVMDVYADWTRMEAHIRVNMLAVEPLDDNDLNRIVCHELCHVLVNEMRIPAWANVPNEVLHRQLEAEERVVTMLTSAFDWVFQAGAGKLDDNSDDDAPATSEQGD